MVCTWLFGIFSPVLVHCVKKNLAALLGNRPHGFSLTILVALLEADLSRADLSSDDF
jgi:hypothetical protein